MLISKRFDIKKEKERLRKKINGVLNYYFLKIRNLILQKQRRQILKFFIKSD